MRSFAGILHEERYGTNRRSNADGLVLPASLGLPDGRPRHTAHDQDAVRAFDLDAFAGFAELRELGELHGELRFDRRFAKEALLFGLEGASPLLPAGLLFHGVGRARGVLRPPQGDLQHVAVRAVRQEEAHSARRRQKLPLFRRGFGAGFGIAGVRVITHAGQIVVVVRIFVYARASRDQKACQIEARRRNRQKLGRRFGIEGADQIGFEGAQKKVTNVGGLRERRKRHGRRSVARGTSPVQAPRLLLTRALSGCRCTSRPAPCSLTGCFVRLKSRGFVVSGRSPCPSTS